MLKVHCIPQKILYENTSDDYKVLSCKYIDSSEEMELSKYNSFTLSGENLGSLILNQEAHLIIQKAENSKYPNSYLMLMYDGIDTTSGIHVESKYELEKTDIPHIVVQGRKGGSNVAAAIINAILYAM